MYGQQKKAIGKCEVNYHRKGTGPIGAASRESRYSIGPTDKKQTPEDLFRDDRQLLVKYPTAKAVSL